MICELLDFRCIFVNELVGSVVLSMILLAGAWFVFAARMKMGFRTIISVTIPLILIAALAVSSISIPLFFLTVMGGLLIGNLFSKLISNR